MRYVIILVFFSVILGVSLGSMKGQTVKKLPVDSCAYYKRRVDTLNHKCQILANQVEWVQYYLALMGRRPKDTVYSRGWLTRAVASKLPPNPYAKPKVVSKKIIKKKK